MTILNYLLDNDLVFYSLFSGTIGFIGYKFVSSYLNSYYVDQGIQTEAWEDYSDRTSQIGAESVTSIDTISPISENISPTLQTTSEIGTQILTEGASTVTTVLQIPPVNIEMIPNPDISWATESLIDKGIQTMNNPESIISITEMDLIDLLESPIKPLDPMMADEWAVDYEWDVEDLIKVASFFN